ncbi:hypothetical protein H6G27_34270 [Nostoc linckia FACHB-104]|nr:hypothetical protein [Nostoc linckia FACHB-104]
MQALNSFKNKLFFFSFGLGLASTVAVFQPNTTVKELGKTLIGFSIAGVVLGELVTSKAFKLHEDEIERHNKIITNGTTETSKLSRELQQKTSDLESIKREATRLENELQQTIQLLKSRNLELSNSHESIRKLESNLKDVGRFSTSEAHRIVRDTYSRSMKKLECHIEALMRNYQHIGDDFNGVLIEVDKFRNRYIKKLEEYEALTSFNDLLDIGLDIQEKIIDGCIELRCKGQTIAIRYLNSLLDDSVSYKQYESDITKTQAHAGLTIKQLKDDLESQVRAIANDWVISNNQHVERYETNYSELLQAGREAVAKLQERDSLIGQLFAQINALEQELELLRKPWTFTGTIDYAVAGNAIINFYYQAYGYILDAISWQEIETGYTLTFATGRNKVYLTADMLHDKDNQSQLAGLTNALTLPTFTPNYQSGLMVLTVQTRQAVKKTTIEKLEADISKIWVPVERFENFVKNFERVRITSGSTGGKSPTAKNLALAIMKARKGKGEIRLYDPQHGSKKDFWNMPKAGTSHEDNLRGIKELCKLIDERRNGRNHNFVLYLFDEVDNTISNLGKESREFKDSLKIAIKEGSHCDIGAIFIGQSADANEIPGMTHSNWNNCVALHIGSNAGIAIDKLTTITTEDKSRLLEQYRKIQDYCDRKNEELGLDIFTDATAYRFALVVPLNGLPKFIQLPDFDAYDYSEIMGSQSDDSFRSLNETPTVSNAVTCPSCGSTEIRKNGKDTKTGKQRYNCKACGENFRDSN